MTYFPFKLKRNGYDSNGKNISFFCQLSNYRRSTSTRSTTHSGSDKDHFGIAVQHFFNFRNAFDCRLLSHFWVGTRTKSFGKVHSQLNFVWHRTVLQSLRICVANDKIYPIDSLLKHVIDGIASASTNTYNFYNI